MNEENERFDAKLMQNIAADYKKETGKKWDLESQEAKDWAERKHGLEL